MGAFITFPLKNEGVCFEASYHVDLTGKAKSFSPVVPKNLFEEMTEQVFAEILGRRQEVIRAKDKFNNADFDDLHIRFPRWSSEQLIECKAQFQTFDLNQDGLIDFEELCSVLDELGDTSSFELRKKYFQEWDEDESGAVDFEEYIAFLDVIGNRHSNMDQLSVLASTGTENAQKIRKLSIVQQIDHGLF